MPSLLRILAIALGPILLSGCVADRPFRNGTDGSATAPVVQDGQYLLAHVEFDDQGWFHDVRQRQALFDTLRDLNKKNEKMLIVTYTHGWKHNAGDDDDNLRNFRTLLGQLDLSERAVKRAFGKPRRVVGVYIGWRGASIPVPVLENVTFWSRKNAAERVGTRSVKQLFIELNQFRTIANKWEWPDQLASNDETQLIFVGHSFGGLVTYHALYAEILARGLQVDMAGQYQMAKSFGDFVLLVNPAFEGAAYEPIWQAAQLRGCYSRRQKPAMAIVTSSADRATRYAFPAGRLYTYFQSATLPGERDTVMHTVGHLARYRTHRLVREPATAATPAVAEPAGLAAGAQPNAQASTQFGEFRLVKTDTAAPERMPYLVIQAGPEMIADHNDLWNEQFRRFTVQFIASQVMAPIAEPSPASGSVSAPPTAEKPCIAVGAGAPAVESRAAAE